MSAPPRAAGLAATTGVLRQTGLQSLVLLVALVAGVSLGLSQLTPPAALPTDAPPGEFAAGRAVEHLRAIAQAPHPVGSAAHADVEQYLLTQLTALGLEVDEQRSPTLIRRNGLAFVATLHTIVARLPGSGAGDALALLAHYDSNSNSPGASDDGSQVAMLLEVARVLRAGPQLRNDLLFIFTDGEEEGVLGGQALAKSPLASQIGLALNFEAVGTAGPALLFETSVANGALAAAYAATPLPVGYSYTNDIYHALAATLSNITDLTPLMQAGIPGMNVAHVYGRPANHTMLDNIAMADPRSIQHQGETALALARHFGNASLDQIDGPPVVYFTLLRGVLVRYPAALALPLALLVSLLAGATLALGWRSGQLTARGLGLSALVALAASLGPALLAGGLWWANVMVRPDYRADVEGSPYNGHLYLMAFLTLTLAAVAGIQSWLRGRATLPERLAGALLWWWLLMLASSLWAPGSSYLLTWPLAAMLLALGWLLLLRPAQAGWPDVAVLALAALPALVLLAPAIYLMFHFIGLSQPYTPEVPLLEIWVLVAGLLLNLLLAQLDLLARPAQRALPAGSLGLGVVLIVAANLIPGTVARPIPEVHALVRYWLLPDQGQAFWMTEPGPLDDWRAPFFSQGATEIPYASIFPPLGRDPMLHSAAQLVALPGPQLEVLEDTSGAQARVLRLRVFSPRHAQELRLYFPPETDLRRVSVDGLEVPLELLTQKNSPGDWQWLPLVATPEQGVELRLELGTTGPLDLFVLDRSSTLPAQFADLARAVPPNPLASATLIGHRFSVGPSRP